MATLHDDLLSLAEHATRTESNGMATPSALDGLEKINWQRLICFAIPIYNLIAPMSGLPPLPLPAFCTTPASTIPDGA